MKVPMREVAFPVGAENLEALKRTRPYTIEEDEATFTRTGEDGAEVLLPLFGGDEGVGEVLEGHWKKWWDADFLAAEPFTREPV